MSRVVIAVTVPPELAEKLDAQAESEYRSRSSLASQLIARGLEERNSKEEEVNA